MHADHSSDLILDQLITSLPQYSWTWLNHMLGTWVVPLFDRLLTRKLAPYPTSLP